MKNKLYIYLFICVCIFRRCVLRMRFYYELSFQSLLWREGRNSRLDYVFLWQLKVGEFYFGVFIYSKRSMTLISCVRVPDKMNAFIRQNANELEKSFPVWLHDEFKQLLIRFGVDFRPILTDRRNYMRKHEQSSNVQINTSQHLILWIYNSDSSPPWNRPRRSQTSNPSISEWTHRSLENV